VRSNGIEHPGAQHPDDEHHGPCQDGVRGYDWGTVSHHELLIEKNPGKRAAKRDDHEEVAFEGWAALLRADMMAAQDDERRAYGGSDQGEPADDVESLAGEERRRHRQQDRHGANHEGGVADGGEGQAVELDQELDGDAEEGRNEQDPPFAEREPRPMGDGDGRHANAGEEKAIEHHGLNAHLIQRQPAEVESCAPEGSGKRTGAVSEETQATAGMGQRGYPGIFAAGRGRVCHCTPNCRIARVNAVSLPKTSHDGRKYVLMVRRLLRAGTGILAGLGLAAVMTQMCPDAFAMGKRHHKDAEQAATPNKPGVQSSQPPALSIPVEPLGFNAPSTFYLGQRERLLSLDFLDENHLLFTFHTPGLIHRANPNEDDVRQIRAMVLKLPQGTVDAEALWTVHGRERYLWMLKDGKFLLKDRDNLEQGDATLELKPLLHFPGPLLWMEMDPTQSYLVTDSYEPEAQASRLGDVPSPSSASAEMTDGMDPSGKPDIVVRILRRSSGQVMLVSHVRTTVHLPINADGYLDALRSTGKSWLVNLSFFTGGSKNVGKVDSTCSPPLDFVSHEELVANTCTPDGGRELVAMSTDGRRLWKMDSSPTQVWPMLVMGQNGTKFAVETLTVSHAVAPFSPLSTEDVKGQMVQVFDAAEANQQLSASASPVLDGGGNVAISPSGAKVAVLDAGAIQVYELNAQAAPIEAKPAQTH